ncbi:hypothetical protein MKW94_010018 [Papaver nudicaule]|uniref:EXS domain-containing protein n=1 Tax=Papaver nudicaule TaxID=74823 RepID=A0AA41S2Y1_PAPNU|nr:hypothetical protein [Papaver nudicaule]
MIALTIFSVYSDLFVDWNLRISDWFLGVPTVTTQIFVHRMWWYYGFIVLSIFLRVSWAWRLSDLDSSWLPFLLSLGIGPRGGNELAAVGAGAPAEPVVNIED